MVKYDFTAPNTSCASMLQSQMLEILVIKINKSSCTQPSDQPICLKKKKDPRSVSPLSLVLLGSIGQRLD